MKVRDRIIGAALIVLCICAAATVMFMSPQKAQYEFKEGDVCTADIFAPRAVTDEITTSARRDAAEAAVEVRYKVDASAAQSAADRVADFLAAAYEVRESENTYIDARVAMLRDASKLALSDALYEEVCSMSESDFSALGSVANSVRTVMEEGVDSASDALVKCDALFQKAKLSAVASEAAREIAAKVIAINRSVDEELTQKERAKARSSVAAVEYRKNQIIARRGEILSAPQIAVLTSLGYIKGASHIAKRYILGVVLLLVFMALLLCGYVWLCASRRARTLTGILISVCVSILCMGATLLYPASLPEWYVYAMPMIICPFLLCVLLDVRVAIMLNTALCVVCAAALEQEWGYALMTVLAGSFAALIFSRIRRRSHLVPAAFLGALTYSVVFAIFALMENAVNIEIIHIALAAFVGQAAGSVVMIGTLPLWEAVFDVSTPLKLGELAHPEHKLQKRLLLEAPGTYHHCLTVANMCEAAAGEIGANPLLARVGAYYHDVGKLKNPLYFGENQFGSNPHDMISPRESARIIKAHVPDGVLIAKQYHLPSDVRNIIAQHHGTTVIAYFLHKAREEGEAQEADFRYDGPRPQSREAAIVLLGDACEAAVRSMREKSAENIEEMVKKVVAAKISDGQLDESFITFRDVDAVTNSFIKTLKNYLHARVEYPSEN